MKRKALSTSVSVTRLYQEYTCSPPRKAAPASEAVALVAHLTGRIRRGQEVKRAKQFRPFSISAFQHVLWNAGTCQDLSLVRGFRQPGCSVRRESQGHWRRATILQVKRLLEVTAEHPFEAFRCPSGAVTLPET
jgi:hypothetical protein